MGVETKRLRSRSHGARMTQSVRESPFRDTLFPFRNTVSGFDHSSISSNYWNDSLAAPIMLRPLLADLSTR